MLAAVFCAGRPIPSKGAACGVLSVGLAAGTALTILRRQFARASAYAYDSMLLKLSKVDSDHGDAAVYAARCWPCS
ncbi:MAG: hypothetical protein ACLTV6_02870 [Christensenellales bacterium]